MFINVPAIVGAPGEVAPETGARTGGGVRRCFVLCNRHAEQRRHWVNLAEGDSKEAERLRVFRAVVFCHECQELSWTSPVLPPDPQAEAPPTDTYSWWRDVMGQP